LETARSIEDARTRALALRNVAAAGGVGGDVFREAAAAALEIPGEPDRIAALRGIAESQSDAGLFADACETASQIEAPFTRYRALSHLAAAQAAAGADPQPALGAAWEAATAIIEPDTRERARIDILGRFRERGLAPPD